MTKFQDRSRAIGVFDSGLGGLTVVKELMRRLPAESIVYYGDTARVPYGTKSQEAIVRFSRENTKALLRHNVKIVVVACNSSSSYALAALQKEFRIPIVGVIHAGAQKAVEVTRNRRIGIIATTATINSGAYAGTIQKLRASAKVFSRACPLFVPLVEEGWLRRKETLDIAEEYLRPLKKAGVDTLILGCTHYPLLKPAIQKVLGRRIVLIDSAREVALEVKNILGKNGILRVSKSGPRHRFLVTDRPQAFEQIAKNFLGFPVRLKVETNHV